MNKIIKNKVSNMGEIELARNQVFLRDGETWYRDYEREISARDLMREICTKYISPADASEMDDEMLDDMLYDNLQFGTDELEGVFAMYYKALCGMADMRAHLEVYEESGLPIIQKPWIIKAAPALYGKKAQVDVAIEEMSELTKALLKERRYELDKEKHTETHTNIIEEIADVFIMLAQLLVLFDKDDEVQAEIEHKLDRLSLRLKNSAERVTKAEEITADN